VGVHNSRDHPKVIVFRFEFVVIWGAKSLKEATNKKHGNDQSRDCEGRWCTKIVRNFKIEDCSEFQDIDKLRKQQITHQALV